ncbi:MAG: phosphatidylglycerophosphatase A family protein [Pyrinomonadaceae bacterium]
MTKPVKRVISSTRSFTDYVALALATSAGVGYVPFAPGACGSLVGVLIYLAAQLVVPAGHKFSIAHSFTPENYFSLQTSIILIGLFLLSGIGIWSASRTEKILNQKDPGIIVIDEVVGQLITYLFVPLGSGIFIVCAGFFLFRLFDIWKPYPIKNFESLKSGLGVVADDAVAGVYAAIVLSVVFTLTQSTWH